jgi:translation elongation factor EF-1alpha
MMSNMEERIGSVIRFFDKTSVAAVKLDFGDLAIGDTVRIKGASTDFTQKVETMEFDHQPVQKAIRGQFTGIKLSQPAKPFDLVYKVTG